MNAIFYASLCKTLLFSVVTLFRSSYFLIVSFDFRLSYLKLVLLHLRHLPVKHNQSNKNSEIATFINNQM
jgi:hypothetical protein